MASATKKHKLIRKRKKGKMGQGRKRVNRNQGTSKTWAELFGDNEK